MYHRLYSKSACMTAWRPCIRLNKLCSPYLFHMGCETNPDCVLKCTACSETCDRSTVLLCYTQRDETKLPSTSTDAGRGWCSPVLCQHFCFLVTGTWEGFRGGWEAGLGRSPAEGRAAASSRGTLGQRWLPIAVGMPSACRRAEISPPPPSEGPAAL